jgi:hypothetical protein
MTACRLVKHYLNEHLQELTPCFAPMLQHVEGLVEPFDEGCNALRSFFGIRGAFYKGFSLSSASGQLLEHEIFQNLNGLGPAFELPPTSATFKAHKNYSGRPGKDSVLFFEQASGVMIWMFHPEDTRDECEVILDGGPYLAVESGHVEASAVPEQPPGRQVTAYRLRPVQASQVAV